MIQKININWENCYGIKLLKHEFLFGKSHSHLIYAPNGTMKTSFAKTMKFLSGQTKEKPQDFLSNENTAKYVLTIDGVQISKENIFVVNGDEEIDSTGSFINFLASTDLKKVYDNI